MANLLARFWNPISTGTSIASLPNGRGIVPYSRCLMEAPVAEDVRSSRSDEQALQLAHEIERILSQMQADLEEAEAKLAHTRTSIDYPPNPSRNELGCLMLTAREMADRVMKGRERAWDRSDPTVSVVATQKLNPDDERAVRRTVQEAGYSGEESEQMIRQVSALVVGLVVALADDLPATNGD